VRRRDISSDVSRLRLHHRLNQAIDALPEPPATPTVVVDVDAFDSNADDLTRRAGGTPIRVASKSLRVPALITRALSQPGFAGVLSYSLREALWLHEQNVCDDILMGYPSVDRAALRTFVANQDAARAITLMVDDVAHLDLVDDARDGASTEVRIAIDIDAGFRLGRSHVGPKRSPLYDVAQVLALAQEIISRPGFELVGVMTYEGQIAGVPDDVPGERARSLVVRRMKSASIHQLGQRRIEIAEALRDMVELKFWNAGGTGSIGSSAADPEVTEVSAGSGLLGPHLFDNYSGFAPLPAAFFGLRVARRPAPEAVTVAGGGLIASGAPGLDRSPLPWSPPGLHLTGLEGAGEVQTPLVGPAASSLRIGDLVWFRHAKSGEVAEHTNAIHLLAGAAVVETVSTYRGKGNAW